MNKHDIKKVVFMFGAGAESAGNFNIKTGFDFLKHSLFPSNSLDDALQSYFKNSKYFENTYTYTKNKIDFSDSMLKNLLTQKASTDKNFFEKYEKDIVTLLSKERVKHICKELSVKDISKKKNKTKNKTEIEKNIKAEFENIVKDKCKYCDIKHNILAELFFERANGGVGYDSNISISGLLDGYFHTIINPQKYSKIRFSKIFNFYWSCYFTVLEDILNWLRASGSNEFNTYFKKDNEKETLNYLKLLENIYEITDKLYEINIEDFIPKNSYYSLINDKLTENADKVLCEGIITTNYFKFCELISKNTVYLNGQLKYFEYPECLEVKDVVKTGIQKDKLMFPFIFGQSLVKPIVNHIQVEEFSKMKKILTDSDMLIILGFNINEDDNHINAYLHDFVNNKPILIVSNDDCYDAEVRLKYKGKNIYICKVNYNDNENVVNKIFETIEKIISEREPEK